MSHRALARHFSAIGVVPMSMSISTPTLMGAKGRPWGKDFFMAHVMPERASEVTECRRLRDPGATQQQDKEKANP